MKNGKSIKKLYLILGFGLILLLGVGYAVLNTTLNINGVAEISKNTWDVHFENIIVKDGNVTATTPATISDNGTEVSFTVPLSKPGDTYIFEIDIVNSGTIDAMLNETLKTGITTENEKYLMFDVTYKDGSAIAEKDALYTSTKHTLLVTVGYSRDISNDELVITDESVSLSLKMNYVQSDETALEVGQTLYRIASAQAVMDNIESTYVTSSTGVNFELISSDTNGKGVYTISSTSNKKYPIRYYRGNIDNNNVIFAGFCWKIVRTTDTGGVKLVYNGLPNDDGSCTATGENTSIGTSYFNQEYDALSDSGYMYGTRYEYAMKSTRLNEVLEKDNTSYKYDIETTNYIYSDTITYDSETGMYMLVNGENRLWSSTYIDNGNLLKYTCFSETEAKCSELGLIVSSLETRLGYLTYTGGEMPKAILNDGILFGNDVTYDENTGMYTLINTKLTTLAKWWKNYDYQTIAGENGYHYTCFNENNTCSEVSYIYNLDTYYSGPISYITLQNGKKVEDAINEMFTNTNDSAIKGVIDTWYSSNMTDYTSMLEDTIWCNDRSISAYNGWHKDSNAIGNGLHYSPRIRTFNSFQPSLQCMNPNDSFTVSDTINGNGKLDYPVGLLTSDEVMYAGGRGSNANYYLYTGSNYFTLSPGWYGLVYATTAYNISVNTSGGLQNSSSGASLGVRPSISLKNGIVYSEGNGSKTEPYIVEKQ